MFYEVLGDEPVTPEKKAAIQEILQDNKDDNNIIFTSVITHVEIVPTKLENKRPGASAKYLALFDGKKCVDVEISRNVLMLAREIREFYYKPSKNGAPPKLMDAADAVHLATAAIYKASAFHARDDDSRGTKIPLVSLYKWSGNDRLCGKYPLDIVSPEHAQKALDFPSPPSPPPPAPVALPAATAEDRRASDHDNDSAADIDLTLELEKVVTAEKVESAAIVVPDQVITVPQKPASEGSSKDEKVNAPSDKTKDEDEPEAR